MEPSASRGQTARRVRGRSYRIALACPDDPKVASCTPHGSRDVFPSALSNGSDGGCVVQRAPGLTVIGASVAGELLHTIDQSFIGPFTSPSTLASATLTAPPGSVGAACSGIRAVTFASSPGKPPAYPTGSTPWMVARVACSSSLVLWLRCASNFSRDPSEVADSGGGERLAHDAALGARHSVIQLRVGVCGLGC